MKLVIVSDSHGGFGNLKKVVERETPFDLLVHLGDGLEELARLGRIIDFQYDAVNGNNDPPGMYPGDLILKLQGKICLFTHGDRYGVISGLDQLVEAARRHRAKFVFFGHTHQPCQERIKGVEMINPGSICFYISPRPTYITWELETGRLEFHDCSRGSV